MAVALADCEAAQSIGHLFMCLIQPGQMECSRWVLAISHKSFSRLPVSNGAIDAQGSQLITCRQAIDCVFAQ
jgi:hypothetical protein